MSQVIDQPASKPFLFRTPHGFRNPTTVPRRFSIGAFLGITTLWSVMVMGLQQLSAPIMLYYFFGIQLCLVCLAQMRFEKSPRWASCVVGGVIMYAVVIIAAKFPYDNGRTSTTMFTASQFVGFWGGDNYMVYRAFGMRMGDVWFSGWLDELLTLIVSIGLGGAYGYAIGTFTAGVFLVGNRFSQWVEARADYSDSTPRAT